MLNPDGTVAWSYTNDLTGVVTTDVNSIIQLQVSSAGHLWAHGHPQNAPLNFGVDSFVGGLPRYGFLLKMNAATGVPLNVYNYGNHTGSFLNTMANARSMSIMANGDLLIMGTCECFERFSCHPHSSLILLFCSPGIRDGFWKHNDEVSYLTTCKRFKRSSFKTKHRKRDLKINNGFNERVREIAG